MNTKQVSCVAAIGLLLVGLQPVNAQYGYNNRGRSRQNSRADIQVTTAINTRIATLQTQIRTMQNSGQIGRRQSRDLSRSLSQIISMRDRSLDGGRISSREAARINSALDNLTTQVQTISSLPPSNRGGRSDWDRWNWNEQRSHLRSSWRDRHAAMAAAQQAQLDAQMKAQWLQYHHNNWNGQYTWDQYNDPAFLDYLHNNNPSLLTTLRNALGF